MEKELETVGTVAAAKRRIVEVLAPIAERGLAVKNGKDWFRKENDRRRREGIDELERSSSGRVRWGFTDILRTMGNSTNWPAFQSIYGPGGRRLLAERNQDLFELATLRNWAMHDEEEERPFSEAERDRFFELALRLIRPLKSPLSEALVTDIQRVVSKLVPADNVRAWSQPTKSSRTKHEPIAVLGPSAVVENMLKQYPPELAERWRHSAIDGAIESFSCPHGSNPYGGFTAQQIICEIENKEWPEDFGGLSPDKVKQLAIGLVGDAERGIDGWLGAKGGSPGRIRVLSAPIAAPVLDRAEVYVALANSDYFTARTITELSRLNRSGLGPDLGTIFPERWGRAGEPFTAKNIPYHVSAQGVVVCRADDKDYLILGSVNTQNPTITSGWGTTMAEQMWAPDRVAHKRPWWDPFCKEFLTNIRRAETRDGDRRIEDTLQRGLQEELTINMRLDTSQDPLLLSVAIEEDMYFVTFIFFVLVNLSPLAAYERWRRSPDYNEMGLLAAYQLTGPDDTGNWLEGPRRLAELMSKDTFDAGPCLLPETKGNGIFVGPWHCSSRLRMYAAGMHLWPEQFPNYVQIRN